MSFELVFPETLEEAVTANENGARWFAGGTDLIPEIKLGLAAPSRLVNLKQIDGLRGIQEIAEGVRIGALTTLAELAESELIRSRYTALAEACELSASPQIRNVATIAGNLCQDSRCPYYRNLFHCYLRGGDTCYMRNGENREAAVIGYHDCVQVHPSDPANALVLFDAQIVVQGGAGERTIASRDFFRAPDAQDRRMNVLEDGEIITAVVLPQVAEGTRSAYEKAMDRATWTFALASAAVRIETEGSRFRTVGIVVGGVAPMPWREFRVENALSGMSAEEGSVTQVLVDVLDGAQPLEHNGYKRRLARAITKRAILRCVG